MHKKIWILIVFSFAYNFVLGQQIQKKFSPLEMREDIDTLVKYLEQAHPNIYSKYSQKKFYTDVQNLKNSLDRNLSKVNFYLMVEPLLGKLEDGHTDFHILREYNSENPIVFPYFIKLSSTKPFIICNNSYPNIRQQIPANAEIISINNISSSRIANDIIDLNTGENRSFRADFGGGRFYFYLEALYKANGRYTIKYRNKGIVNTISIRGINKRELDKIATRKRGVLGIKINSTEANYSLKILEEDKTAIIKFKSFDWNHYKSFADSAFTVIKEKGIKNLIIDLIDNGGGDSDVGDDFFQYILDKPFRQYEKVLVKNSSFLKERLKAHRINKTLDSTDIALLSRPNGLVDTILYKNIPIGINPIRFSGPVYLLVNLQTYSSASDFAQCFRYYKRGVILGQETGGLIKSYGDIVPAQLPRTRLNMTISSALYYNIGAEDEDWTGVIPDISVPSPTALTKTLNLIRSKKTKL